MFKLIVFVFSFMVSVSVFAGAPFSSHSNSKAISMTKSQSEANSDASALAVQMQGQKQYQGQHQYSGQNSRQKTDSSSENNIAIIDSEAKKVVNSSAITIPSECASGASGTGRSLSVAMSQSSAVCDAVSLAAAYSHAGEADKAIEALDKAASLSKAKANWCMFNKVVTLGLWPCG